MLSHQTSNANRTRQHRRQQSTPTAFETHHVTLSPATISNGHFHRRGMSLIHPSSQDERQVGITNQGHYSQQCLQEAHTHNKAPPGQSPILVQPGNLSAQEFRNLQHQQLDAQLDFLMKANSTPIYENGEHYVRIERSRSNPEHPKNTASAEGSRQNSSTSVDEESLNANGLGQNRHNGRPLSSHGGAIQNEKSLSLQTNHEQQRPFTPPHQSNFDYFPITPAATPFVANGHGLMIFNQARAPSPDEMDTSVTIRPIRRNLAQQSRPLSELFGVDNAKVAVLDPNATVKPNGQAALNADLSCSDLFNSNGFESMKVLPSPPNTVPLRSKAFDVAAIPSQSELDDMPMLNLTPLRSASEHSSKHRRQQSYATSAQSSVPSSPEFETKRHSALSELSMFTDPADHVNLHISDDSMDYELYGSPEASPQAMSIADLSLEGTVEDTGISAEEVQAYISEQDANDQKWTCLFPECGKRFGRRENIRSHIQTHLGDRQFKCAHCSKRFVRQHDLKRHSKIHSGVKPYPCRCGQSFARHDALTRHRQRNMCVGAFEGIVKKTVKRGRPRKRREGDDDRLDKAIESRKRALAKSYASSVSCTSESSRDGSPTNFIADGFEHIASQVRIVPTLNAQGSNFLPPDFFSYTPPLSPYSTGNADSPQKSPKMQAAAQNMPPSPAEGAESDKTVIEEILVLPSAVQAYESQMSSQAGSPPELSHSSPPSSTRLPDLDFGPLINGIESQQADTSDEFDMFTMPHHGEDMFTSAWDGGSLLSLEKESGGFRFDHFNGEFDDQILFSDNCGPGDDFL